MEIITTGINNGTQHHPVAHPDHFAGTANEAVLAKIGAPTNNIPTGKTFPIEIQNTGGSHLTVSYLEFTVRALTNNVNLPFEFGGAVPRERADGANPAIKYLHYIVPNIGLQLAPGQTHTVGTVTVLPPLPANLSWSAALSFWGSGPPPSRSRIKTAGACTSLNTSFNGASTSAGGDPVCSTEPNVRFKIEAEGLACSSAKVKVGLRSAMPLQQRRVSRLEFDLDFTWSAPGVAVTGVNFPASWPNIACSTSGCFGPPSGKMC